MLAISVKRYIFIGVFRLHRLGDIVGQRDDAIADAAHLFALRTFAPAAAVRGLDGKTLPIGFLRELVQGIPDDELAQAFIGDAELVRFAFAIDQAAIFGVLLELCLVASDN